ncbi:hypothetical protein ACFLSZ_02845 [Candidatus Bipolaricaulota bacterium]
MPILTIEVVLFDDEAIDSDWAGAIANAAGEIFGTPSGRTWVRIRGLPRSHYAENGIGSSVDLHPVFVSVLKATLPGGDELRIEAGELTTAIAEIAGRPAENVHVLYLPQGEGRISFGGTLVE